MNQEESNNNGCLLIFIIVLIMAMVELCDRVEILEKNILQNERTNSIIQSS